MPVRINAPRRKTSAAAQALRERVERYRGEEGDLLTSLQHAYRRAGDGRIEIADDGRVTLVEREAETHHRDPDGTTRVKTTGGRTRVLAEHDPTAARLCKLRATLSDTVQRRDAASEAAKPLVALVSACTEHLRGLGWREV